MNEKVSKWNQEEVKVPDKEYKEKRQFEKKVTHQSDEEEEDEERSAQHRFAEHIAVADGGHRHDEEINTCPIR